MIDAFRLSVVYGVPILYLAFQFNALMSWRGNVRRLALIPLVVLFGWTVLSWNAAEQDYPIDHRPPVEEQFENALLKVFSGSVAGFGFLSLLCIVRAARGTGTQ